MGQTDTVITEGALKPVYEKILQLAADRKVVPDSVKAVKDVIQAYRYLGSYYIAVSDLPKAKEMWLNILAIDANDAQAIEVLNAKEFKPAKEQKKPRK
jgi:tetratricopeptide (TPR) repeat protein